MPKGALTDFYNATQGMYCCCYSRVQTLALRRVCVKCVLDGSQNLVTAESPDSVLRSLLATLLDGLVGLLDG